MVGSGKNCIETRRAESGGYLFLERGNQPPPNQLEGSPVGFGAQPQPKLNVWSWRGGNQSPPNQLEDSPVRSGAQPQLKSNLVYFSRKI